jgi:hypothetical protein
MHGCTSATCEPFFIYCSWPSEGHDSHASPKPLCAGQRGPEPCATWWLPTTLAGLRAVGHAMALEPPRAEKQGSKSVGRVIVPEPSHLGSKDPERWGTWWHVDAHPTPGLTWGLYVGVNGLQGTNKPPVKDSLVYHG